MSGDLGGIYLGTHGLKMEIFKLRGVIRFEIFLCVPVIGSLDILTHQHECCRLLIKPVSNRLSSTPIWPVKEAHLSKKRQQAISDTGIVEDRRLFSFLVVVELLSESRIVVGNRNGFQQVPTCDLCHECPDRDHGTIRVLGVLRWDIHPVPQHLGISRKHLTPWNSDVVESQSTIVCAEHSLKHLWSHLVDFDSRHQLLRVEVPKLREEQVVAVLLAVDDQSRHHDRMGCPDTSSSYPKFGTANGWRVDDELIRGWIKRRRRLDPSNVGAMAQLGLGIGAKDLKPLCFWDPYRLLLIRHLSLQVRHEYCDEISMLALDLTHRRMPSSPVTYF